MRYKMLKLGSFCSVGIDEVRNEYVFANLEGAISAESYYSISKEMFDEFPVVGNAIYNYLNSPFICSHYLYNNRTMEQLCRLYEKEVTSKGSLLVIGNNGGKILKTKDNKYICLELHDKALQYDIFGIDDNSIFPEEIIKRILGPKYYAMLEIKPTVNEIIEEYIENNSNKFKFEYKNNI